MTDSKGHLTIVFRDLKPGRQYTICMTASSPQFYKPVITWEDDDIIVTKIITPYNPNLAGSDRHIDQLIKYKPKLGEAIQRFIDNQELKKKQGERNARLKRS